MTLSDAQSRGKAVSRADLVRWLHRMGGDTDSLERVAPFIGFELEPSKPIAGNLEVQLQGGQVEIQMEVAFEQTKTPIPSPRWYRVTERTPTNNPLTATDEPLSIESVSDFSSDELEPAASQPLFTPEHLIPWARLWPVLKRASSIQLPAEIDVQRAAEGVANGQVISRLPCLRQFHWSKELVIVVDNNRRTLPFWNDFHRLGKAIERLHGRDGLDVRQLGPIPGISFSRWRKPGAPSLPWKNPPPGTPIIILSDLGLLDPPTASTRQPWRRFGDQLMASGCKPFVLAPVSSAHIDAQLSRCFHIALWSRNSRLRRQFRAGEVDIRSCVEELLVLLSPAIRIEPELLRAVRHLLPADKADAGCEAEFWRHPDLHVSPLACAISKEVVAGYRQGFRRQPLEYQRRILQLLRLYHAHLFPAVMHEETLIWASVASPQLLQERQPEIEQAERFMRRYARLIYLQRDHPSPEIRAYGERHFDRSDECTRRLYPYLSVVFAVANQESLRQGSDAPLPAGLHLDEVRRALDTQASQPRLGTLLQRGQDLVLAPVGEGVSPGASTPGSPYAELSLTGDGLFVGEAGSTDNDALTWRYVPLRRLPQTLARLGPATGAIQLHNESESLRLEGLVKPPWATAIGRDRQGLFTEVFWLGARCRLDWRPPQAEQDGDWASDQPLGVDEYGLFADLSLGGVTQRFRWILPGTFVMGSPENEPERFENEIQHQVTLTRGFWLADTACTQALWQAVMGKNPSHFQADPRQPVESVSWEDVQQFIDKLNARVPGLSARLPSEAEWEYACRAGTTTPFSFGANISPEQVNYNGEYPYAGGEKGVYRGRTVPVGSLPPNPWGLHEMHGNVWEWCQDWFSEYPREPVIDPWGPEEDAARVLRGGSWIDGGGLVRSALRYWNGPAYRINLIGFRLALGQGAGPAGEAGQARGTRDGQAKPLSTGEGTKMERLRDRLEPR